jgi:hypothetical protein
VDAHPHGLIKNHQNTIFPPFLSLKPTIACCFQTFTKHHFIQK